jgi:hypothetical protein
LYRKEELSYQTEKWITALDDRVSLKTMMQDYLRHFELYLDEINELIKN